MNDGLARSPRLSAAIAIALLLGAPAAFAEKERKTIEVDVSKGGLTVSSGETSFHLGGYMHLLYSGVDRERYDADDSGTGVGVEDGYSSSFSVRRARIEMKGTMYRNWLKYAITYELSETLGSNDSKIKDVYLRFAKFDGAHLMAGQYKVPFSMQELTSDTRQQFVDRSITNVFAPARDQGVTVTGTFLEKKRLGYAAGVFNGSGDAIRQEDQGLLFVGRVWFDPFGEFELVEGTVDAGERHDCHFGLAYRTGEVARFTKDDGIFQDPDDQTAVNFEAAWRWNRLAATAEYFVQTNEFANPVAAPDLDQEGWHAQIAVAAIPQKLELGLRFAMVDGDTGASNARSTETRFGVQYYILKYNLKIQADLVRLDFEPEAIGRSNGGRLPDAAGQDVTDDQIRIQAQLAF
jgi:hypothetical protein